MQHCFQGLWNWNCFHSFTEKGHGLIFYWCYAQIVAESLKILRGPSCWYGLQSASNYSFSLLDIISSLAHGCPHLRNNFPCLTVHDDLRIAVWTRFLPPKSRKVSGDVVFEGYSTCKGNLFFLCSITGQFHGYSACSLVAIPSELSWLLMLLKKGLKIKWILLFKIYHWQRNIWVNVWSYPILSCIECRCCYWYHYNGHIVLAAHKCQAFEYVIIFDTQCNLWQEEVK
jgi:hypothetical protein